MYVIGALGSDNVLGRTFVCNTLEECDRAFRTLLRDNCDSYPGYDVFDDDSVYCIGDTVYFCGILESL